MKRYAIDYKNATIIDVRNDWEFGEGHAEGAVNIPLFEIPARLDEIRALKKPLLLCCASGNRSNQATVFLKQSGLEDIYDGGSWLEVNALI